MLSVDYGSTSDDRISKPASSFDGIVGSICAFVGSYYPAEDDLMTIEAARRVDIGGALCVGPDN